LAGKQQHFAKCEADAREKNGDIAEVKEIGPAPVERVRRNPYR